MLARADFPPPDDELFHSPYYAPEPPPTPSELFGKLAVTLGLFLILAYLLVWLAPRPACELTSSDRVSAVCIDHAAAGPPGNVKS